MELYHHGIKGQKWGIKRYQDKDGDWTNIGLKRRAEREGWNRKSSGDIKSDTIIKSNNNSNDISSKKKTDKNTEINKTKNSKNVSIESIKKAISDNEKANSIEHIKHERIIEEAQRSGKSGAQIEQEHEHKRSFKLTDNQKKAIAIGAAVTITALAAYGAYKFNVAQQNKSIPDVLDQINNRPNKLVPDVLDTTKPSKLLPDAIDNVPTNKPDASIQIPEYFNEPRSPINKELLNNEGSSAKSDFIKNAFGDGDYYAFEKTGHNKQIINDMLTPSSSNWWNSLTKGEKKAIYTYTGSSYIKMNTKLWDAHGENIFKHTDAVTAGTITACNKALKKASYPVDMVCTHGLSTENACNFLGCSKEELLEAAKNNGVGSKLIGTVNTNYGFVSATSTAEGGFSGVKCKILTPKGAHAAYIEHISQLGDLPHHTKSNQLWDGTSVGGPPFSSEFETLFPSGTKFKTKGIQYNTDKHYIEVALEYLFD